VQFARWGAAAPGGTPPLAEAEELARELFETTPHGQIPPGGAAITGRVRSDAPAGRYTYKIKTRGPAGEQIYNTPEFEIKDRPGSY
jgi:hypothetical protein